jgi:hypothetical protein
LVTRPFLAGSASLAIENVNAADAPIAPDLADRLSEYDGSQWICVGRALAAWVAEDFSSQRLLDLTSDRSETAVLAALLRKGGVIVEMSGIPTAPVDLGNCFRVALVSGTQRESPGYHIAIDPSKFQRDCLISLIGDAFLDWIGSQEKAIGQGGQPA